MESKGVPQPDSGAALFIGRILCKGETHFFPAEITSIESLWWAFVQEYPGSPVTVQPLEVIDDLPESALAWTFWPGALWRAEWTPVGNGEQVIGAIRFAAVDYIRGHRYWTISRESLRLWGSHPRRSLCLLGQR
ncbi:hypothetical protein EI42_03111 [Thermosporothrix hazakensis]|uniref:Uncharacterized protein n=2 Tax=Thermosporothrix hazakensis TaxID=644383 RepID=A0A326U732_THEHA|nr:hypothetical protein EI42_03111 [Thermosporothrix hazakensis]